MYILLNRLLAILNDEDPKSTNYHIATVLTGNLEKLNAMAIQDVSGLCAVSKSTVSKFVREIGFDDYTDFRLSAVMEKKTSVYGLQDAVSITDHLMDAPMEEYLDILKGDIDLLRDTLDMEKLRRLARDLAAYPKVAAFGSVYSETAALDLQYKLAFRRKIIHTNINDVKQTEYIRSAGEDTLIIVFTNSGQYIWEYQLEDGKPEKDVFSKTKARVAAITSNRELEHDSRVDLCVGYGYTSCVQTHPMIFQILTDLLAVEYQRYMGI